MATPQIQFVKQPGAAGERTCGAACLSMVYGSYGKKISAEEIWPEIRKLNRFGSVSSMTHLMAKDAIARGYDALVMQASHPLQVLRIAREHDIRLILNHRMSAESPVGHFSVLAGTDKTGVILHDPLSGPARRYTFDEFLALWRAASPLSETIGFVLLAIAPRVDEVVQCRACKLEILEHVECPGCHQPVRLRPAAMLGCIRARCGDRMWRYVCCPECDCTWSFEGKDEEGKSAKDEIAPPAVNPFDVDQVYKELNQFLSFVKRLPGSGDNEDIVKQMDFIASQKEVLRMAIAETAANQKLRLDQLNALSQTAQANKEAQKKKAEEAARQSPPLDGDALGMALLRDMGFGR